MSEKLPRGLGALVAVVNDTGKEIVSAQVFSLPVDKIESDGQVRKAFHNIDELALSLISEGQQSPIIVSPRNDKGIYIIQKGERRWRAAKEARLSVIDAIIKESPENKVEKAAGELIENIQREDLEPMEIANALNVFIEGGWSQQEIVNRLGKSKSFVSAHLSLLRIPPCAMELSESGIVNDTETLNILRLIYDADKSVCESLCEKATKEGFISRKTCRDALNELLNPKSDDEPLPEEADQEETYADTAHADNAQNYAQKPLGNTDNTQTEEQPSSVYDDGEGQADGVEQADKAESAGATGEATESSAMPDSNEPESTDGDLDESLNIDPAEWSPINPSDLEIKVTVNVRDTDRPAILMLERISKNPLYTWVHLTDENIGHRALVTDVTLKSVKKNPYRA